MLSRTRIQIAAAGSSLILLMTIGTVVYRFLEEWTWIQSFYFSVVTLSTVGYGDLHPTSDASRLFTAFYILGGGDNSFVVSCRYRDELPKKEREENY